MRQLLSILMAGWLFTATALGWCCHPVSVCAPHQTEVASADSVESPCCGECQHKSSGQNHPTQPGKCRVSCLGICKSMTTPRVQFDIEQNLRYDLALIGCESSCVGAAALPHWSSCQSPGGLEPPLRLHLFHQILLI